MATKVIISDTNRQRLIKLLRTVPSGGYARMADRIIQSKWMREMLAEAYDSGFRNAEEQHDGFSGVSGWVNNNPWRD